MNDGKWLLLTLATAGLRELLETRLRSMMTARSVCVSVVAMNDEENKEMEVVESLPCLFSGCLCVCVDQGGRWSGLACNRLISLVVGDRRPSPNKSPKSRRFGRNGSDHVASEISTKSIAFEMLLGHKKDGGVCLDRGRGMTFLASEHVQAHTA